MTSLAEGAGSALARNQVLPTGDPSKFAIMLTRGKIAIIDRTDLYLVGDDRWYAKRFRKQWYAVTNIRKADGKWHPVYMHRVIMGVSDPEVKVDHRDCQGLHNSRDNLRIATRSQNTQNICKTIDGYLGVSWRKEASKWRSQIMTKGRSHHLGYFHNPLEAACVYDDAARELHGAFARLNFPEGCPL